jgi:microcystin-dependent protein
MKRCSPLVVFCATLAFLSTAVAQSRFLGSVEAVPYNFAPHGSVFCNGQLLSIAQNTALFSLLGTTYGGNGVTTFALPDLRGRVAIGMGQGPGLQNYVEGESGGEESVTLTVGQIPAHSHAALGSTAVGNTVSPAGNSWAVGPRVLLYSSPTSLVQMARAGINGTSGAVASAGGNQPHENRKPFLTLNYIIWMQGIYPSRN